MPETMMLERPEEESRDFLSSPRDHGQGKKRKGIQYHLRRTCTKKLLFRRLPFLQWVPTYNLHALLYDFVAGITVGLTCIPQGIAYASVAGLPLHYGLYSAFMGPFVYILLGTTKEISVGPTAIMSLMTHEYSHNGGTEYAVLLAFLTGLIELAAGFLNLGFLVDFISAPVISGFCSAAAITVASTQAKGLFGLKFEGSSFVEIWAGVFSNITKTHPWDAALGFGAIILLLLMKKMTGLRDSCLSKRLTFLKNQYVHKTLWFLATSRNAIAVIIGCVAAYLLDQNGQKPFTLTGKLKPGLPSFEVPPFWIERNDTATNSIVQLDFGSICQELGAGLGLIPLVAILEQVAIAKAFSAGKRTDATQEMIALGVGNMVGSFFGSMPVSASFGRSSVQSFSGAQTPLTNLFVGTVVLLALGFLMPAFSYIPKAILAAVIITSVIFMVEYEEIKPMWKTRRWELFPFTSTFLLCLFLNMEYGILIGAGIHLVMLTYESSKVKISQYQDLPDTIRVKPNKSLYFVGIERFRNALQKVKPQSAVLVDLEKVDQIDYSGFRVMKSLVGEFYKRKVNVYFTNVNEAVKEPLAAIIPKNQLKFHNDTS